MGQTFEKTMLPSHHSRSRGVQLLMWDVQFLVT